MIVGAFTVHCTELWCSAVQFGAAPCNVQRAAPSAARLHSLSVVYCRGICATVCCVQYIELWLYRRGLL